MIGKVNFQPKSLILMLLLIICLGTLISYQPFVSLIIVFGVIFIIFGEKYTAQIFFFGFAMIIFEGSIASFFANETIQNIIGAVPEAVFSYLLFLTLIKNRFKLFKLSFFDFYLFLILAWSVLVSLTGESSFFMFAFGFRLLFRFLLIYWIIRLGNLSEKRLFIGFVKFLTTMVFIEFCFSLIQLVGKVIFGASSWNTFGNNLIMSTSIFGVQGTFNRYDAFGMFFGFSSIVILGYYYFYEHKKIYLFAYLASLICIFVSTSRQAIVISLIGAVILILAPLNKRLKLKFSVVAAYVFVLVCILAYFFIQHSGITNNGRNPLDLLFSLFDGSTYTTNKTQNFRMYFITVIGSWLIDNHFLGMGLGTFGATFSLDQFKWLYFSLGLTDNFLNYISDVNWISILGQIGLIGLIAFAVFLISFAINSLLSGAKQKNGLLLIASAITIAWAFSGLFGPNFEIKSNAMFFWVFFGLVLKRNCKDAESVKD